MTSNSSCTFNSNDKLFESEKKKEEEEKTTIYTLQRHGRMPISSGKLIESKLLREWLSKESECVKLHYINAFH